MAPAAAANVSDAQDENFIHLVSDMQQGVCFFALASHHMIDVWQELLSYLDVSRRSETRGNMKARRLPQCFEHFNSNHWGNPTSQIHYPSGDPDPTTKPILIDDALRSSFDDRPIFQ